MAESGVEHTSHPGVQWLLSSKDPSVRYLTLVEVLGASPRSGATRQARAGISRGPRVTALLRGQRSDGGFGVHPYTKWSGAHWRLISLVELAFPGGDRRAIAAAGQVLRWLTSPQRVGNIRAIRGLVRQHASQDGNALAVCCRLGLARDRRVRRLVESLLRAQWPDGGWNCDPDPHATHSSFHETLLPVWGLWEYSRATGDADAADAAERGAELLLEHRLFRAHTTGAVVDEEWLKLHYPPYWHYDVLQALLVLARCGRAGDPRAVEALDLIKRKRGPDGTWSPDGRRYWRAPGAEGGGVEVVDWGRHGSNEMLTLNALRILAAAGRLD